MLQNTQGIVLHTTPYSESSIVARIYTRHWGIQAFLINSVRSAKARNKAVLFQPLSVIDLEAYHKANRGLQKISKVHNTLSLHQSSTFHPAKVSIAFFIAEVIYKSIKEEHPDHELFDFLYSSIHYLIETPNNIANFHLAFMIGFSRYLGFYPQANPYPAGAYFDLKEGFFTQQTPTHSFYTNAAEGAAIDAFIKLGITESHTIPFSRESRRVLLDNLTTYYNLHISNWGTLKSMQVLEDVFS